MGSPKSRIAGIRRSGHNNLGWISGTGNHVLEKMSEKRRGDNSTIAPDFFCVLDMVFALFV
jgi:hypothetical protein